MRHSLLGNGLLQQAICQPPSVVDASIRTHHSGPTSSLVSGASSRSRVNRATRKPLLRTKFVDIPLTAPAKTCSSSSLNHRGNQAAKIMVPRAVIAADPPSELGGKFILEGNTELQAAVTTPSSGSLLQVDLLVTNSSGSLILHWGVLRHRNKDWKLPSRHPNGTTVYKNKALRTPFQKSGPNSSLRIEIDDPEAQAIEFLIFDEAQNKWFKNNGQNFQIQLSGKAPRISSRAVTEEPNVSLPEDLVQLHAYLRWEKKGRQMYTPEKEKASSFMFIQVLYDVFPGIITCCYKQLGQLLLHYID